MLRRCFTRWAPSRSQAVQKSSLTPLEALTQIQLGISPPLGVQRGFLLEHCESQLEQRGITEAKLLAMDGRLCAQLLKEVVLEMYISVPFRAFSFDMEFTGPPIFTAEGPTEDITELGLYSPLLEDTFSCLVKPACGRRQGPGVEELTHISDAVLAKEGIPFDQAWEKFLAFVHTPQPGELPGSEERILLLSHGGKLADVSLIKWTLEKFKLELPSSFVFGDTIHLIRDAHRRRPVTVDKHPPSWKLLDIVQWLKIPPTLPAHRAGNDAKMTWDALYHTLLRYGDDDITPRDQLVSRFFDEEARRRVREYGGRGPSGSGGSGAVSEDDAVILEDDVFAATDSAPRAEVSTTSISAATGKSGHVSAALSTASDDLLDMDFDEVFSSSSSSNGTVAVTHASEEEEEVLEFSLDDMDVEAATGRSARRESSPVTVDDTDAEEEEVDIEPKRGKKKAKTSAAATKRQTSRKSSKKMSLVEEDESL